MDESLAGKRGRCKACGHGFVVPGKPKSSVAPAPAPARSRPAATATAKRPAEPPPVDVFGLDEPGSADDDVPTLLVDGPVPEMELDDERVPVMEVDGDGDEGEQVLPRTRIRAREPEPEKPKAKKKKKRKRGESSSSFDDIVDKMLIAAVVFAFALLGVSMFSTVGRALSLGLLSLGFLVLAAIGTIGLLVVAFQESVICGLLMFFVPFYVLYYVATRWEESKRFFKIYLVGVLMFAFAVFLGGVHAGRAAADQVRMREQMRQQMRQNAGGRAGRPIAPPRNPFAQ
jgi:hypothetical protein